METPSMEDCAEKFVQANPERVESIVQHCLEKLLQEYEIPEAGEVADLMLTCAGEKRFWSGWVQFAAPTLAAYGFSGKGGSVIRALQAIPSSHERNWLACLQFEIRNLPV